MGVLEIIGSVAVYIIAVLLTTAALAAIVGHYTRHMELASLAWINITVIGCLLIGSAGGLVWLGFLAGAHFK